MKLRRLLPMTIGILVVMQVGAIRLPIGHQPVVKNDTLKVEKDTTHKVKKKEPSAYERVVKDSGSVRDGLFTVRHIKNDWYFEVPDTVIGRLLLAVTRFISVPQDFQKLSGEEVNRSAIYFEQYNDKTLFLREYVQSQFARPQDQIALALRQSTVDPIIYKFDVIGRNPKTGNQLINVSRLFLSDNKIAGFSSANRTTFKISSIAADRTFIDSIRTYPINVEVQTLRTYSANADRMPASQSGSVTLSLNTSIVLLPKEPMKARLWDERVGYFVNRYTQFADNQQANDHEAIISRYRLEPKDVARYRAGRLTEPKKQIVYYIDPATPKKWVKYLKAGIEDWNKAFEAAGFKNAIAAKDWPNDSTMSLDDARFCVMRYLPAETENAYGPRIVDPRSGEIIESHICWYHNVMNLLKKWYMVQCGPMDARARKMTFSDELMGQLIRFVSSHEVGHTLGLRHNMGASHATPVEKLRDKKWVEAHGHTASIMDYARFNYVAQPEDHIGERGLFPRINDYDIWAIKWGYQYRPEFKDAVTEKRALRTEVSKALADNHRLWYIGDEGRGDDPRSQSEDLGDNNMRASDYGIKNLQRVIDHIEQWTAQPDGQYKDLQEIHKAVCGQYIRYTNHVLKNIGGRYTNTIPGMKPYDNVPRKQQKEAVNWLGRQLFNAPLWLYPDRVTSKLGVDAFNDICNRQSDVLGVLLSPTMLYQLQNTALTATDPYPVDEYLTDVFATVWKPITDSNEQQNSLHRLLERAYINCIGNILNPQVDKNRGRSHQTALRSDVVLYASAQLDQIEQYVKARQATSGTTSLNQKHDADLLLNISKIRKKYESGE